MQREGEEGGSGQGDGFVFVAPVTLLTLCVCHKVPHQNKGGQIRKTKKGETVQKSGEGGNLL